MWEFNQSEQSVKYHHIRKKYGLIFIIFLNSMDYSYFFSNIKRKPVCIMTSSARALLIDRSAMFPCMSLLFCSFDLFRFYPRFIISSWLVACFLKGEKIKINIQTRKQGTLIERNTGYGVVLYTILQLEMDADGAGRTQHKLVL